MDKLGGRALGTDDLVARDAYVDDVVASLGIADLPRRRIHVPPGGVVLAHYDLMHRGTRADPALAERRFMYKFYLLRRRDPDRPAWHNTTADAPPGHGQKSTDGVVDRVWHWLRGDDAWQPSVEPGCQVDQIVQARAEDERVRLAYEIGWLARVEASFRGALAGLIHTEDEAVRRAMVYAAGIAGGEMEPYLLRALADDDPRVRRVAAAAVGEARLTSNGATEALFTRLEDDPDDLVRSNAAYALGNIARRAEADVPATRLLRRLDPAVEADNSGNGGMARSTVRVSVAYALCNARLDADDLAALATTGLADHDRYVRGLVVAILEREARDRAAPWLGTFAEHLAQARYNHRPPRPEGT